MTPFPSARGGLDMPDRVRLSFDLTVREGADLSQILDALHDVIPALETSMHAHGVSICEDEAEETACVTDITPPVDPLFLTRVPLVHQNKQVL